MEPDLERCWQKAVRQKNLDPKELKAMVKEMEREITVAENWNERMRATLTRERVEIEERYGVKIGQTDIKCARCGRPWGYGGHACQDIRFEKLREAKKATSSTQEAPKMDATVSESESGDEIAVERSCEAVAA